MANLIIKSSADNLVLQGSDESPAITVGATGTTTFAENATLSGTANVLGTINATGTTFPSGHVVGQAVNQYMAASQVGGNQTAYTDSAIEVNYTPKYANTESYLILEWDSSMAYLQSAASHQIDATMRTASNSTYTAAESIMYISGSYGLYINQNSAGESYFPLRFKIFCGTASGGMYMPATKSTWSANDVALYFRIFHKASSGNFYTLHTGALKIFSVTEVMI